MNEKVKSYLSDKAQKLSTLTEDKIAEIKKYLNTHSKQLKRSATALALAGLVTTSAMGMTGCDDVIPTKDPSSTSSTLPTNINGEEYVPQEHFNRPTMRTEEEIEESGLTAEDVLAAYDNLAWELAVLTWKDIIVDLDNVDSIDDISAQFEKISVYNQNPRNQSENFPFFGLCEFERGFPVMKDKSSIALKNTYQTNLYISSVLGNYPTTKPYIGFGIYKDEFEPVADALGNGKFLFTEDIYNSYPDLLRPLRFYINLEVYAPFEITRDTILNASQQELQLLYDMCKSMYSLNIEGIIPPKELEENQLA